MYFDNSDRDLHERDFRILRNISGVTLAKGTPVILDPVTVDGTTRVTLAVAGSLGLFAGIAFGPAPVGGDLADGEYGLFQTRGYCDYARVANHSATPTAIGDVLGLIAAQSYLQRIAADDNRPGVRSLEVIAANAVITVATRKIWLGF